MVRYLDISKYQDTYSNLYYIIRMTLQKKQEYVGHIQEENGGQHVMFL